MTLGEATRKVFQFPVFRAVMSKMPLKEVRVFSPATVANVACGFDVLGFAIEQPGDEIVVRKSDKPGFRITKITGDDGRLPLDPKLNTAGVAVLDLLRNLGKSDVGIEMEVHKKLPFGSGLGSSAASAVGGAFAVNRLLGEPLSRRQLLPFVVAGEAAADGAWHADNVGPCLLGGITLIRSNAELDVHNIPIPENLWASVIHPDIVVLTKVAREIMPRHVQIETSIQQSGNLGGLICGLFQSDYALIGRSVHDLIAEPHRQRLIPEFYRAKKAALNAGALGFSISGAGPSVFALCEGEKVARTVAQAVTEVFSAVPIKATAYVSRINPKGVHVLSES